MKVTEDRKTFVAAARETAFGAVAVKSKDPDAKHGFGRIVSPIILAKDLRSSDDLERLVNESGASIVIVRSWGWDGEKTFVWEGSIAEFNETWRSD